MAPACSVEFVVPLHVEDLALDFEGRYTVQQRQGPDLPNARLVLSGRREWMSDALTLMPWRPNDESLLLPNPACIGRIFPIIVVSHCCRVFVH